MNNVSGNTYGATTANKQTQKEGCNINGKLKEKDVFFTGQVLARDGIKFTNVTANAVKCSMGAIKAINSTLNDVSGRDGIKLKSVTALGEIKSSMGKVDAEDSKLGNVEGRDGVKIQRSLVDSVKSSMGSIKAKESTLGRVKARDGMTLYNSSANSCNVTMGDLSISAEQKRSFKTLLARNNINLKNITAEKVESKCGKVNAEYCTLKEIESTGELSLVRSTCGSAKLFVEEGNKGILTLSDSTIEGNLIVEVIKGGTNMFGSNISTSSGSTCSIISGRTFQIVTSSIDAFDCTYMQNGSTGTVNGIPYKFEGGKFVSLARVEKKSKVSEEIEIEINGNGLVNGNIVFKGCTGKVTITANAKVGGIKNLQ